MERDKKEESKRGFASLTYPSPSLGKGGGQSGFPGKSKIFLGA